MNKIGITIALIFSVILLTGSIVGTVYVGWQTDVQVNAYLERAQIASSAEDMNMYLNLLKNGMEDWGYTEGHYALIFKTPWNDAELDYRAVNQAISRTEMIMEMDKMSPEYQTGMDDVRGIIREIELNIFYHWQIHTFLMWGLIMELYILVGAAITFLLYMCWDIY